MKSVILGVMGILTVGAIGSTTAASESMSGSQSGGDATPLAACQNVDIKVNNPKGVKIKALKVDYETVEDGVTRTEDFADAEVAAGAQDIVARDQDLQNIEGHTMRRMTLHYKAWCGGKWSVTKTETDSDFDAPKCNSNSNKVYRIDLGSSNPC